ncbi:hypothetical protein L3X38_016843 [Prunus dulcis]|uniref:Uncharacterized protein n=1 Tax=Prunus dulcis TaxID=3755 RepID=A0AAD4W7Z0_PRUDU|nr:hypothetical protein L3X38_016843 [Prunus dulcis]
MEPLGYKVVALAVESGSCHDAAVSWSIGSVADCVIAVVLLLVHLLPTMHFGSTDICDFEASLSHIQQIGSLANYLTHFSGLARKAPEWSDTQLKGVFVGGLREELRFDVQALQPNTLSEAKRLS